MEGRQLFIIAGCNGAGKTTASYTVLPNILNVHEFVNADEIARGLSPFNPSSVAIKAGKLMLERISDLLSEGISFAIETTLATRTYITLVKKAQERGYTVHILFFPLRDTTLAKERVADRVAHGGHDIPQEIIERRYTSGLRNLMAIFRTEVDSWVIYDNSARMPRKVAVGGKGQSTIITDRIIYEKIKRYE